MPQKQGRWLDLATSGAASNWLLSQAAGCTREVVIQYALFKSRSTTRIFHLGVFQWRIQSVNEMADRCLSIRKNSWLSAHDHFTRRPHDRQRRGGAPIFHGRTSQSALRITQKSACRSVSGVGGTRILGACNSRSKMPPVPTRKMAGSLEVPSPPKFTGGCRLQSGF